MNVYKKIGSLFATEKKQQQKAIPKVEKQRVALNVQNIYWLSGYEKRGHLTICLIKKLSPIQGTWEEFECVVLKAPTRLWIGKQYHLDKLKFFEENPLFSCSALADSMNCVNSIKS